jgi:hypothetical protein
MSALDWLRDDHTMALLGHRGSGKSVLINLKLPSPTLSQPPPPDLSRRPWVLFFLTSTGADVGNSQPRRAMLTTSFENSMARLLSYAQAVHLNTQHRRGWSEAGTQHKRREGGEGGPNPADPHKTCTVAEPDAASIPLHGIQRPTLQPAQHAPHSNTKMRTHNQHK